MKEHDRFKGTRFGLCFIQLHHIAMLHCIKIDMNPFTSVLLNCLVTVATKEAGFEPGGDFQ